VFTKARIMLLTATSALVLATAAQAQNVTLQAPDVGGNGDALCNNVGGVLSIDSGPDCQNTQALGGVPTNPVTGVALTGGAALTLDAASTLTAAGTSTLGTANVTTLNVTGTSTLAATTISGPLAVSGDAAFTGAASFAGPTTISGPLSVTGASTFTAPAAFNGGFTSAGGTAAAANGDFTVGRNLAVTGASTFTGPAAFNGGFTVGAGSTVDMGGNRVQNVGGPIVGTDAANKNYVDNEIGKLDDDLSAGIAIATALENPDLTGNETFGVMVNYGNYEGSSAVGISAAGVLGRNVLDEGDRVAIAGGVGVSTDGGDVAGRVGVQWTR
jgi:trimeric autotransporter adhesin